MLLTIAFNIFLYQVIFVSSREWKFKRIYLEQVLYIFYNLLSEYLESVNPFWNQPCITPDFTFGTCQYINYCGHLSNIHQRDVLYNDDIQYLWDSQCGYFNNRPMVTKGVFLTNNRFRNQCSLYSFAVK